MKILKNPNSAKGEIKTCPDCSCEFEYTNGDVSHYSNGIMGPGYRASHWVCCPNCGRRINL